MKKCTHRLAIKSNAKFVAIQLIVKLYFFGALAVSFTHIIGAAHKLDLYGWQAYTTPFAIDGIAVIGLIMRGPSFSGSTRKLGFRVQLIAGMLSLACNIGAGNSVGERIYGFMIVALFVFSEWLTDRLEGREADDARALAAKKAATVAKANATRAANREATERMVKAGKRRINRELANLAA